MLDEKAIKALRRLEATGMSRAEAIGSALVLASKRVNEAGIEGGNPGWDDAEHEDLRQMADYIDRMRAAR